MRETAELLCKFPKIIMISIYSYITKNFNSFLLTYDSVKLYECATHLKQKYTM